MACSALTCSTQVTVTYPLISSTAAIPSRQISSAIRPEILTTCPNTATITGEHGVGVEKINEMCVQFPGEELTRFHAKTAFDAKELMNPGKAIPTLNRCTELPACSTTAKCSPRIEFLMGQDITQTLVEQIVRLIRGQPGDSQRERILRP